MKYKIKNWERFQHYKDRNPPWIKLHFTLLSSSDWVMMDDSGRVLAVACMLVASRNDGVIDGSPEGLEYLQRVAYLHSPPDLKPLVSQGFLSCESGLLADASTMLADASVSVSSDSDSDSDSDSEKTHARSKRRAITPKKPLGHIPHAQIIDRLNARTGGHSVSSAKGNQKLIWALWKLGHRLPDFLNVIEWKCDEWGGDPHMDKHLKPSVLFRPSNFEKYLADGPPRPRVPDKQRQAPMTFAEAADMQTDRAFQNVVDEMKGNDFEQRRIDGTDSPDGFDPDGLQIPGDFRD